MGVVAPQVHPPPAHVVLVVLVVVGVTVVVDVVAGHMPEPVGSQRTVIFARGPPFGRALMMHFPSFLPFFFVRTVTFAWDPQTASVPLVLTLTFPTGPHFPFAWTFLLSVWGVHVSPSVPGW